jgi:hypothetical protein
MVGHEQWFVAHLGWLERLQGRLDDAVRYGRAAVTLARGVAQAWFGPAAAALLAGALLELGDSGAAAELLTEALRDAGPDGAEVYRLRCLAPLAEATGDTDALVKADALLAAVQAPPQGAFLLGADAYLAVARSWLRRGDPARARAVLDPLLVAARRLHFVPVLVTAGLLDVQAAAALGEPSETAHARITALGVRHGMPVAART